MRDGRLGAGAQGLAEAPPQRKAEGLGGGQKRREMEDPAEGFPWNGFTKEPLDRVNRIGGDKNGVTRLST